MAVYEVGRRGDADPASPGLSRLGSNRGNSILPTVMTIDPECNGSATAIRFTAVIATRIIPLRSDDPPGTPSQTKNWCWRPLDSDGPLRSEFERSSVESKRSPLSGLESERHMNHPAIQSGCARHDTRSILQNGRSNECRRNLMRLLPASIGPSDLQYHY